MKLEHQDYYIEDGRYVFTAHFHLKRGSCCGNKCRHCPFCPKHLKNNIQVSGSNDYLLLKQSNT